MTLPGWNNFETARTIHDVLALAAIIFLILLVVFEVLEHLGDKKKTLWKVLAIISFAIAIGCESFAYPYNRRLETLTDKNSREQKAAINRFSNQVNIATNKLAKYETSLDSINPMNKEVRAISATVEFTIADNMGQTSSAIKSLCNGGSSLFLGRGGSSKTPDKNWLALTSGKFNVEYIDGIAMAVEIPFDLKEIGGKSANPFNRIGGRAGDLLDSIDLLRLEMRGEPTRASIGGMKVLLTANPPNGPVKEFKLNGMMLTKNSPRPYVFVFPTTQ